MVLMPNEMSLNCLCLIPVCACLSSITFISSNLTFIVIATFYTIYDTCTCFFCYHPFNLKFVILFSKLFTSSFLLLQLNDIYVDLHADISALLPLSRACL